MDKFVVKKPRTSSNSSPVQSPSKKKKQVALRDLQRVVNIDDIKRHKARLDLPRQTVENILSTLKELEKKIPPRHVFQSTQIGKSVKKFRKSDNQEIRELAIKICHEWNDFFVKHQQKELIEVKCDLKTETFRKKAVSLLAEASGLESTDIIVENLEREIFFQNKRLVNKSYRRAARMMVFKLKNNQKARNEVLKGLIDVKEFVSLFMKKS